MATGDKLLDRFRPHLVRPEPSAVPAKSIVQELLDAAPAEAAPPSPAGEAEPETPAAVSPHASGDGDPLPMASDLYKAHSRPSNKQETGLGLLLRDVPLECFAYSDLRRVRLVPPEKSGGGPVLMLKFTEPETMHVVVQGSNLLVLADYLRQHRIGWLRELPNGKPPFLPGEPVITSITIVAEDSR